MIETLIGGDHPYRYSALRGQFIAADRKLSTLPIDWVASSIGTWHLYHHPDSYLQEIHKGSQVGWLVDLEFRRGSEIRLTSELSMVIKKRYAEGNRRLDDLLDLNLASHGYY